jgi:protein-L-isoaspartate(D-aspartate) O-methyltransferase
MLDSATKRRMMVDNQLRTFDVTNQRILGAVESVSREAFLPEADHDLAYADRPVAFADGRVMLSPMVMARLLQTADVGSHDRVLDVGCCTGYSSAVLSHLARHVTGIENQADLVDVARNAIKSAGIDNVTIAKEALDGKKHKGGPYDVIIVHGGFTERPDHLLKLLVDGGRLVGVDASNGAGQIVRYVRSGDQFGSSRDISVSVPVLSDFSKPAGFQF